MKNIMMILFFMSIFYIESIFGMDNLSNAPSSTTEEIDWDDYIKQESEINDLHEDYKMIACDQKDCYNKNEIQKENWDVENLIAESEEDLNETNKLKRKHKSNKIFACEFCEKESTQYRKGKVSGKFLCNACYKNEYKHGHLISKREIHKNILVCQFCQQESTQYIKSKVSGKSLCGACYQYERKNGHLIPTDERKKRTIHNILGCEFCQKNSKEYTRGKSSGKILCHTCYQYEYKHGHLIPLDKREIHTNILVCEFCQQESTKYRKGPVSCKILCGTCYHYERTNGYLIPIDERGKRALPNILGCEFCQKESKRYTRSKICDKILCHACYQYEYANGHLISLDDRKKRGHKNNNNQLNRLIDAELCQNENEGKIQEKTIHPTHFTKKQKKDKQIRYDDD